MSLSEEADKIVQQEYDDEVPLKVSCTLIEKTEGGL